MESRISDIERLFLAEAAEDAEPQQQNLQTLQHPQQQNPQTVQHPQQQNPQTVQHPQQGTVYSQPHPLNIVPQDDVSFSHDDVTPQHLGVTSHTIPASSGGFDNARQSAAPQYRITPVTPCVLQPVTILPLNVTTPYDITTQQHDVTTQQHDVTTLPLNITTQQQPPGVNSLMRVTLPPKSISVIQPVSIQPPSLNTHHVTTSQYVTIRPRDATTQQHDVTIQQHDISTLQNDVSTLGHDDVTTQHDVNTQQHDVSTLDQDDIISPVFMLPLDEFITTSGHAVTLCDTPKTNPSIQPMSQDTDSNCRVHPLVSDPTLPSVSDNTQNEREAIEIDVDTDSTDTAPGVGRKNEEVIELDSESDSEIAAETSEKDAVVEVDVYTDQRREINKDRIEMQTERTNVAQSTGREEENVEVDSPSAVQNIEGELTETTCILCNTEYKHRRQVEDHIDTLTDGDPPTQYCCKDCPGARFPSRDEALCHAYFKHTGCNIKFVKHVYSFACFLCPRRFNQRCKLEQHLNTHSHAQEALPAGKVVGVVCFDCVSSLTSPPRLKDYPWLVTSESVRKFLDMSAKSKVSSQQTREEGNGTDDETDEEMVEAKCEQCEKSYKHRLAEQYIGLNPPHCKECQMQFESRDQVLCHAYLKHIGCQIVRYINRQYYQCPLCCRKLQHRNNLEIHLSIHSQLKAKSSCGQVFEYSAEVKKHNKTHTSREYCPVARSKNYLCPSCVSKYPNPNQVKRNLISEKERIQMSKRKLNETNGADDPNWYPGSHKRVCVAGSRISFPVPKTQTCSRCLEMFTTKTSIEKYVSSSPEDGTGFQCVECGEQFDTKDKVLCHVYLNHTGCKIRYMKPQSGGSSTFICLCGRSFLRRTALECHLQQHSQLPFKCPDVACNWLFESELLLRAHLTRHGKESSLFQEGVLCGKCVMQRPTATQIVKQWPCPRCPRTFRHKIFLSQHMRDHSRNLFKFKCPATRCAFAYKNQYEVKFHIQKSHPKLVRNKPHPELLWKERGNDNDQGYRIKCHHPGCEQIFISDSRCNNHENKDCKIVCPDCGITFMGAIRISEHYCLGRTTLCCPYCPRRFKHGLPFRIHMKKHSVMNFRCSADNCGYVFRTKQEADNHFSRHHIQPASVNVEKPEKCSFTCIECERVFRSEDHLRLHKRSAHARINPCNEPKQIKKSCPHCPGLVMEKSFYEHMKDHEEGRYKFKCQRPGCPWIFKRKLELEDHEEKHQKDAKESEDTRGAQESDDAVKSSQNPASTSSQDSGIFEHEYDLNALSQDEFFGDMALESSSEIAANVSEMSKTQTCSRCSEVFESKTSLEEYVSISPEGGTGFQCVECGEKFDTKDKVLCHVYLTHTGCKIVRYGARITFVCSFCGNRFAKRMHLEHHLQQHSQLPFKCPEVTCNWLFEYESLLRAHLRKHGKQLPLLQEGVLCGRCVMKCPTVTPIPGWDKPPCTNMLPCTHCLRTFANTKSLSKHIRQHEANILRFVCPGKDCGWAFLNQIVAEKHIQKWHPELASMMRCSDTSLDRMLGQESHVTSNNDQLRKHMREHEQNLFIFKCPVKDCKYVFKTEPEVNSHFSRIHSSQLSVSVTMEKPEKRSFTCIECERVFRSEDHLRLHKRSAHARINPCNEPKHIRRSCPHCPRLVMEKSLYEHMKDHEQGRYKFKCQKTGCPWVYKSKGHLEYHEERMHQKETKEAAEDEQLCVSSSSRTCVLCCENIECKASIEEYIAHAPEDSNTFQCTDCGEKFNTKEEVVCHASLTHIGCKIVQINCINNKNPRRRNYFVCCICDRHITNKLFLTDHLQQHSHQTLRCNFMSKCPWMFDDESQWRKHRKTPHRIPRHQGVLCGKCISQLQKVPIIPAWQRQKQPARGRKYVMPTMSYCPHCLRQIRRGVPYKLHIQEHEQGLLIFKCPADNCKHVYKTKQEVDSHFSNVHNSPSSLISVGKPQRYRRKELVSNTRRCLQCLQYIKRGGQFKLHIKEHEQNLFTFKCPADNCKHMFKTQPEVDKHFSKRHTSPDVSIIAVEKPKKPEKQSFPCDECERAFRSREYLRLHRQSVHKRTNPCREHRTYSSCPDCPRSVTQERLQAHMNDHYEGKYKFRCLAPGCTWVYTSASKLASHKRKHMLEAELTNVTTTTCAVCCKGYECKKHVQGYMERGHCTECRLESPGVGQAMCHAYLKHTGCQVVEVDGEKRFVCFLCGIMFLVLGQLENHLKNHTQIQVECRIKECGCRFWSLVDLLSHQSLVHKEPSPPKVKNEGVVCPGCLPQCRRAGVPMIPSWVGFRVTPDLNQNSTAVGSVRQGEPWYRDRIIGECLHCKGQYESERSMNEYVVSTQGVYTAQCTECLEEFPNEDQGHCHAYFRHTGCTVLLIENKRFFMCFKCGHRFAKIPSLVKHLNTHSRLQFECTEKDCDWLFRTEERVRAHHHAHDRGDVVKVTGKVRREALLCAGCLSSVPVQVNEEQPSGGEHRVLQGSGIKCECAQCKDPCDSHVPYVVSTQGTYTAHFRESPDDLRTLDQEGAFLALDQGRATVYRGRGRPKGSFKTSKLQGRGRPRKNPETDVLITTGGGTGWSRSPTATGRTDLDESEVVLIDDAEEGGKGDTKEWDVIVL